MKLQGRERKLLRGRRHYQVNYDHKFVVFFDILGWRNHIAWADKDPTKIAKLYKMLEAFSLVARQEENSDRATIRITTFSDNVVWSHSLERQRSLIWMLGFIQLSAAYHGFWIRGGLTAGNIVHNEDVVFGPALNRAYELESKIALYPRIVVDSSIVARFKEYTFIQEEDGVHFFDPFNALLVKAIFSGLRSIKTENPAMLDSPMSKLGDEAGVEILEKIFNRLLGEVNSPLGEKEWKKMAWLFERVGKNLGSFIPAKQFRRTVLHDP